VTGAGGQAWLNREFSRSSKEWKGRNDQTASRLKISHGGDSWNNNAGHDQFEEPPSLGGSALFAVLLLYYL